MHEPEELKVEAIKEYESEIRKYQKDKRLKVNKYPQKCRIIKCTTQNVKLFINSATKHTYEEIRKHFSICLSD